MKNRFALIAAALVLVPGLALAATTTKKKTDSTTQTDNSTTTSANTIGLNRANLKGLSVFAAYDLTSDVSVSGAGNGSSSIDKTFILGAKYLFNQFSPGIALQVGGDYEFARTIQNSNGIQLSTWLAMAEIVGQLAPQFSVLGGLNYGFPSLTNASGASVSGKVGYQFGGSFKATPNFAIDGIYRSIDDSISGGGQTLDAKLTGFMFAGRYLF